MSNQSYVGKHTAAPWKSTPDYTRIFTGTDAPFCYQMIAPSGYYYDDEDRHQEAKANAQLIASAPELLEACKQADKFIGSLDPEIDTSFTYMALCDVVKTLTEAIAKAEGKL